MSSQCHICLSNCPNTIKVNNGHDVYCNNCLSTYIKTLNLSIDIELADCDEWLITGLEDTLDDNQTIRFRNPKTNSRFVEEDLEKIYEFLK